jgi:1-phosphatidylinositol-4-phosphate 5-kinase
MSPEEAAREEELRRQQESIQVVTEGEGHPSRPSGTRHRSASHVPPIPNYLPPPPPPPHGNPVPELPQTDAKATSEPSVPPSRVRGTVNVPNGDDGLDSILPVVEEAGEVSSTGGRSREGDCEGPIGNSARPATPRDDKHARHPPPPREMPPPTPPKSFRLKPESADSGYDGFAHGPSSNGREGSSKVKRRYSRESLNKELPPLPRLDGELGSEAPTLNAA